MSVNSASTQEHDKPPSTAGDQPQWLVAVIANLKPEHHDVHEGPADAGAEYDKPETIQNIRNALEAGGHRSIFLNADENLPFALRETKPDICFNIAEGKGDDSREAHVPALLALLGIPYTASRILPNAISLDKVLTKRLWREAGLPIAPYQEFTSADERLNPELDFPLFVKPSREGTGMGVDLAAKANNAEELRKRVQFVLDTYKQPALVETFLPGREFTVGVLGREDARRYARRPELYAEDGFHRFPILEIDSHRSITPGVYSHAAKAKDMDEQGAPGYLCPADIPQSLHDTLQELAIKAHKAIGAQDVSRVDFRLDSQGNPVLLEINTLPGLNPAISDICIMADAENLPYQDLILEILYLAASRFKMIGPRR